PSPIHPCTVTLAYPSGLVETSTYAYDPDGNLVRYDVPFSDGKTRERLEVTRFGDQIVKTEFLGDFVDARTIDLLSGGRIVTETIQWPRGDGSFDGNVTYAYGYDAAGRLLTDGRKRYFYDERGRLFATHFIGFGGWEQ